MVRGAEGLAVWGGVGLADRAGVDLPLGQVRGVVAAPGRAVPTRRLGRGSFPADTRLGDLGVELGDELVKIGSLISRSSDQIAGLLGLGPLGDPPLLVFGRRVWLDVGFVLEVPAFPALGGAQGLGPFRAGRAYRVQGAPARDQHGLCLAGLAVGAAQLDRADARAVLHGHLAEHVTGHWHGHPVGPGSPGGRHTDHLGFGYHWPPPSCWRAASTSATCSAARPLKCTCS